MVPNDLPVPYKTAVTEKVQAGKCLVIKGGFKTTFLTPDFKVNLLSKADTETDPKAEVVLQFKAVTTRTIFPPELKTEIVVNTMKDAKWGQEQRFVDPFGLGPLSPKILDMKIGFTQERFEFYANDQKFADFAYRLPIDSIDHIEITGDVTLQQVRWENKDSQYNTMFYDADEYDTDAYFSRTLLPNQKKRSKNGRLRKYMNKLGERVIPCCR